MTLLVQREENGLLIPDFTVRQAAFVIETVGTPPEGEENKKFKLTVRNRDMPRRPWSFGTEAITARSDYPGTINSPTEQVLSVRLTDFQLNGVFKDRWNYPGFAIKSWQAFESIVGRRAQFTYRSVFCEGVIKNIDFTYIHEAEIGYAITVSPHHREPGRRLNSSPRTVLNASQLLSEILKVRDELALVHDGSPRFFISGDLWREADEITQDWNATTLTLENIISQRVVLPGTEPSLALKRIADVFRLVRVHAESMVDLLEATKPATHLTYAGAIQTLRFDKWSKGLISGSKILVVAAERASREMLSRANPNLIALYRPKQGEHLMKIANTFYGNPLNWKRIASRNNLGSALILTGEELLIIPEAVSRQ